MNITVKKIEYVSSLDGSGPLYADVAYIDDGTAKPILAVLHGFSGDRSVVAQDIRDLAARGLFCIAPDMRGRGKSGGKFDSGGLDVHDVVDAIMESIDAFPAEVEPRNINITGYSGGGGCCFGAFVRFPDLFQVVAPFFGIAEYGLWHRLQPMQYDADMNAALGGSPEKIPAIYAARNYTLGAANNSTARLHAFWDVEETICPPVMTEKFLEIYHAAGLSNAVTHISQKEDAVRWHHKYRSEHPDIEKGDAVITDEIFAPLVNTALPPQGTLVVCGYVVTRHFQIFIEDGSQGIATIAYDLTGEKPEVGILENPYELAITISMPTQLSLLP
ncbi:MAG: alpha/beta fold hydrolase [Chthoniobacterales bacterium]